LGGPSVGRRRGGEPGRRYVAHLGRRRQRGGKSLRRRVADGPGPRRAAAAHYLAAPEDGRNPYASPLLAPDLGGLPPAFIVTAEYDPLRPEGDAYAQALSEAGVAVEHHVLEGQFHGSHSLATLIPEEAAAYRTLLVSALRRAFNPVA
jgi:acetyl esterase/lipase